MTSSPMPPSGRTRAAPPRRWRLSLLSVGVSLAMMGAPTGVPLAHAQATLPSLGDTSGGELSAPAERQLGERIMREIRRDPAYLRDPVLEDYVQGLWEPLLDAARARGDLSAELAQSFAMEAFLVNSRAINAFALPGGYVGVYLGLMAVTGSRDELASVVAHELAHVTQRHIARSIVEQRQQSLLAVAGMILGVIAASRSPAAGEAMMAGSQAAAIAGQLGFSRAMEREADRIGFGLMVQAGFAPDGMAAMFDRLATASRLNDSGAFPYLRSHPLTVERIGEAQSRLGLPTSPQPPSALPDRLWHATTQARARVLMDRSSDAARSWLQDDEPLTGTRHDPDAGDRLWRQYGQALNAGLVRDWGRAEAALAQARTLAQPEPAAARMVELLAIELDILRGRADAALQALDTLTAAAPGQPGSARTLLLMRAQAAGLGSADGSARRAAASQLQTWTVSHPDDAPAWAALGRLWELDGQRARALRAHAEEQMILGDLSAAIDRLRAAQGELRRAGAQADFVESSVIDARLKVAQQRLRDLQDSERLR